MANNVGAQAPFLGANVGGAGDDNASHAGAEAALAGCDICLEGTDGDLRVATVALDCGHRACRGCLNSIFQRAAKNERSFPAQCCEEISLSADIRSALDSDTVEAYELKSREFSVPVNRRTYCSNNQCLAFIDGHEPGDNEVASCPSCGCLTCSKCKGSRDGAAHTCTASEEDAQAIEAGLAAGMKQCPRCRVLIQLTEACNHMECGFCGHEFCFVCLRRWRRWPNASHACPAYGAPETDAEGYFEGFHLMTGLDSEGFGRDGFNAQGVNRAGELKPPGSGWTGRAAAEVPIPAWVDALNAEELENLQLRAQDELELRADEMTDDELALMERLAGIFDEVHDNEDEEEEEEGEEGEDENEDHDDDDDGNEDMEFDEEENNDDNEEGGLDGDDDEDEADEAEGGAQPDWLQHIRVVEVPLDFEVELDEDGGVIM